MAKSATAPALVAGAQRGQIAFVALPLALVALILSLPSPAQARPFRARFQPDTLELQKPGNLELNVQVGGLYGDGVDGNRIILPDYELDLGITKWLELNIDGAFSLTSVGNPPVEVGGDPLWTSLRFELLNIENAKGDNFGIGLQAGPRFRTVDNARGVGLGSLVLIGGGSKTLHGVANLGVFMDREQAGAFVFGGSVQYEFERRRKWTIQGQLAGVHYFGDLNGDADPDQIFVLAGFGTPINEAFQVSLLSLSGPFAKGDRAGLLAALSWDHRLW